jgi:kynurenine formamidase
MFRLPTTDVRSSGRPWRPAAAVAAIAALLALGPASPARAGDDRDGARDERGHANAALLQAIRNARLIDLSHTWDKHSPIASVNPPYSFELSATHANTRGTFGDGGQLSFTAEVMHWSGQHGAPSIDALGHIGRDGHVFGGLDAVAVTSDPDGIGASGVGAQLAIDNFPQDLLVNRGVLLDVARLVNGDSRPLPPTFEITAQHLKDAAKRQRVHLRKGDTVFIRTGWGQYFADKADLYAGANSPGPGVDAANYLISVGARVVGDDTLTFEQRPPITQTPKFQVFPVHMRLIADSGVFIIENLNLEELSEAGVSEFTAVTPPLKVRGGTGSALRAFALVAKKR